MTSNERFLRLPLLAAFVLSFAGAPALAQESSAEPAAEEGTPDAGEIRVIHVPEHIQEQIRADISKRMTGEVAARIMERARMEGWGLPNVVPSWVRRITLSGDVRLRAQADLFADDNIGPPDGYFDFMEINRAGGFGRTAEPYLNTTEDRERLRLRARIGLETPIAKGFHAGLRLSTGGGSDPVSTNQTLGTGFNRYSVSWDQVWLRYQAGRAEAPWLTMWGGRMPNPWLSTDLVWDSDLGFEGVAATFGLGPNGWTRNDGAVRRLSLTLGAFPLQEVERSRDKWLYGTQLGFELGRRDASRFRLGAAYYVYDNITGVRNEPGFTVNDYTAPGFVQKGNLMFNIRNDDSVGDQGAQLWALAADYRLVNVMAEYDFVSEQSFRVTFTADYVKNVGYDEDEIRARTGGVAARSQGSRIGTDPVEARTEGYQLRIAAGYPGASLAGRWQVYGGYRYLERDAVLDAFTDSDFHLGGTDHKGWFVGAEYALRKNVWVNARWLSADTIDGAPMGVDVAQIDLNARF